MQRTKWIDQCAEALANKEEYPTDIQLKAYIDIQSLAHQGQFLFDEEMYRCSSRSFSEAWAGVSELIVQRQSQIEKLLVFPNCKLYRNLLFLFFST